MLNSNQVSEHNNITNKRQSDIEQSDVDYSKYIK